MKYRTLGRTGLKVSPLGLGTSNFGDVTPAAEARRIIERTVDAGVNLIDLGHIYGDGKAERIVGSVLKETGRRHGVVISTKVSPGEFDNDTGLARSAHVAGHNPNEQGLSRAGILNACDAALQRLQTDHIDLYQTHRPDFGVPIDETLRAFDDLVRAGKVRYIGCSTYPAWSVMEALMVSEMKGYVRFSSEQSPYNLLDRRIENELIPLCRKHGLGILAWAPLGMGVLAGRYSDAAKYPEGSRADLLGKYYARRVTERAVRVGVEFAKLAAEAGITPAQLAILWCKDQPGITAPLIGPRRFEHVDELLAVQEMTLHPDIATACDALVPPGSAVSDFHNTSGWMKTRLTW